MKMGLLASCFIAFIALQSMAQCPVMGVSLPAQACQNSNFLVQNSSDAAGFEWDLCPFDLQVMPTMTKVMNTGLSSSIDLVIVQDEFFYGFVVDASSNTLVRLEFGASRENTPTKVSLGNVGGLLNFPNSLVVVNQEGRWFGVIANGGDSNIILLDFGGSPANAPTGAVLYTRQSGGFANISIARGSGVQYTLLVAEFNSRQVLTLNFPDGLLMPPEVANAISLPGSSPIDVQVLRQCDDWAAMVLSFENKKLYRLDFGTSLSNAPSVSAYTLTFGFEPYRLSVEREGDSIYGFVSSTGGGITRLNFGTSLTNEPTISGIGSLDVLSNSRSLHFDGQEGKWLAFTINFSTGDLFRLAFTADCGASPDFVVGQTPGYVQYSKSGDQKIALTATESDGTLLSSSFNVSITSMLAVDFSIRQTGMCRENAIIFDATDVSGDITEYHWTFGDGGTSTQAVPSHTYGAAASYSVSLSVIDANGCNNQKEIKAHVFHSPVSEFSLPADTPLCTNQELLFINDSQFDTMANPYWRWYINNVEVSEEKNLSYAFTTAGPHTIKLLSGIPGCEDEVQHTLDPLIQGPTIGFYFNGTCLDDVTTFTNTSSGEIDSYSWSFGDGNSSSSYDPDHTYVEGGSYDVTLTGISPTGCNSHLTKTVKIHSIPLTDFRAEEPPLSCSGQLSQIRNLTVIPESEEIQSWLWMFADGETTISNNETHLHYVFANPGTYPVSLTATTTAGCTSSIQKEVTILPSPSTAFTFTSTCEDVPVQFISPPEEDIETSYWEIGTSYSYASSPSYTFPAPGDYPVYVEFYGSNGCVATREVLVHVPTPLQPEFSVVKNCAGQEAIFTDITSGSEPILTRHWDFGDSQLISESPASYTFPEVGDREVTLRVTGESGCEYAISKTIQIVPPPQAQFEAFPLTGAYPLEATFTNLSTNSNSFLWEFLDGSAASSSDASPQYTFLSPGSFDVRLTAYNSQQCNDSFTKTITTIVPLPDAAVEMISLVDDSDGHGRLVITIHNKGNTILKSLPLTIDFAGGLTLQQIITESIMPSTKYNAILHNTIVTHETLRYVCATVDLENDLSPGNNRLCRAFEESLLAVSAYPNPAVDQLRIEWILGKEGPVVVTIHDALGRTVFRHQLQGSPGWNSREVNVGILCQGLYFLVVETESQRDVRRISVVESP